MQRDKKGAVTGVATTWAMQCAVTVYTVLQQRVRKGLWCAAAHLEVLLSVARPGLQALEDGQVGVPGRECYRHGVGRVNDRHLRQPMHARSPFSADPA